MSFIKKLFNNDTDEQVHLQFSRFSKGTFENKAIIEIINTKDKVKIKTSPEFTNELVELLAKTIKAKTYAKGIIFSTRDLSKETTIKFQDIKSAIGVKKHIISQELSKEEILSICKNFPNCSINLSFNTDYGELKVKEKAPRSQKPSKKTNEPPKIDYCVLVTKDKTILNEYAFDINKEFKKATITHTYIINNLIIPREYEKDFAMARLKAKRKGKIIRKINVDGKEFTKEINFEA